MKFYSAVVAGLIVGGGLTYGISAGLTATRYNDCHRQLQATGLSQPAAIAQCDYMLN